MLSFVNDYSEVAHPAVLARLAQVGTEKNAGYGSDLYCESAAAKIRLAAQAPEAGVYFLTGGTQTNQLVIDTCLEPYEGVIAADSGHVSVHEAGAIEFSGHKVLTLPGVEGKLPASAVERFVKNFYGDGNHEHMVFPGMVYISHPTEYGTLYSKAELAELSEVCRQNGLLLYLDGARLGTALACPSSDVSLADIAKLTDVFYIGGTKCGAMFGEALVFPEGKEPKHFITRIKQHGALSAKGFLLGLQFDTLFTDELYRKAGENTIRTADRLRAALKEKGYRFFMENPTNQLLIVLENKQMEKLAEKVNFSFWETVDEEHTAIRFCTSWATEMKDVEALIELL